MSARDGGPAFPRALPTGEFPPDECLRIINQHAGMSLRDYFAAKFMASAIITDTVPGKACDAMIAEAVRNGRNPERQMAVSAYLFADAMLAEREAKP